MSRVLLLHGIARSSTSLSKLEHSIQAAGYSTFNLDYASRKRLLDRLVEELHETARQFIGQDQGTVHFVAHSMGGLLARAYINRHRPPNLGRVVLLAPPSQGSEIADLLDRRWLYRKFFGPAGMQLGTRANGGLGNLLGQVDYPLGIIAGDRAVDPLGWLLIPGPNDGKVSVNRTKVRGMSDHVTLHATHALMMRNVQVIEHTIHFLRHGRFPERQQR